jgi:hypothetical protein
MPQQEDILEQIVEEYLTHQGYFVRHNIKYRPADFKQTPSDIDVLAVHPCRKGPERVVAVNVKSWQGGFDFRYQRKQIDDDLEGTNKLGKMRYRELTKPKWSEAFVQKVAELTGTHEFTYLLAVTLAKGDRSIWEQSADFKQALRNNPIKVIDLRQMVERILPGITKTPAGTDIGRTLQLLRAAGMDIKKAAKPNEIKVEEDLAHA